MRLFKILDDHVAGPPVELTAETDQDAIAEAKIYAAKFFWTDFEVWDGARVVFKASTFFSSK